MQVLMSSLPFGLHLHRAWLQMSVAINEQAVSDGWTNACLFRYLRSVWPREEVCVRPNGQTERLIDYSGSSKRDGGGLIFSASLTATEDHTRVQVWSH